jgi:hypothetical protein
MDAKDEDAKEGPLDPPPALPSEERESSWELMDSPQICATTFADTFVMVAML